MIEDRYLGDGVYASFDGFSVNLDLRDQDSTTRIGLEPQVAAKLHEYCKDCWCPEEEETPDAI